MKTALPPVRPLLVLLALSACHLEPTVPERGFLGLEFAPLTRAAQSRAPFLTSGGALIVSVVPESAADRAGFKSGEIVTAINDVAVSTAADAADALDAMKPGARVEILAFDVLQGSRLPKRFAAMLERAPPPNKKVYLVEWPHTLARQPRIPAHMVANASWSSEIARGPVEPLALKVFSAGRCSALAPEAWRISGASGDGRFFELESPGGNVRAIYEQAMAASGDVERLALGGLAATLRVVPEASPARAIAHGYSLIEYGTSNGFSGFVLYRISESASGARPVTMRIVAVPASEAGGLAALAGAVALSVRCDTKTYADGGLAAEVGATSLSQRCLEGACDDSDLAGVYAGELHIGYVHSAVGDNYLIDPRRDIWATGPSGSGTYHQVSGLLEKLDPGRTN